MKSGVGSCSLSSKKKRPSAGELTACKLFSKLPGKRSAFFNHTIRCSNPSKRCRRGGGEEGSWRAW